MKNRPTKETLIKFARRHALDIDGYYQDEKERDPHKREIDAIVRQLKAVRKQCDSFRKQRDELIDDMAEVKRKAEAWDKQKKQLREMVIFGCHLEENTPSKYMNEAYKIVFKKCVN